MVYVNRKHAAHLVETTSPLRAVAYRVPPPGAPSCGSPEQECGRGVSVTG